MKGAGEIESSIIKNKRVRYGISTRRDQSRNRGCKKNSKNAKKQTAVSGKIR